VNRDGNPDVITGGWFEGKLVWKENPGKVAPGLNISLHGVET
jgi:hypothetical protein